FPTWIIDPQLHDDIVRMNFLSHTSDGLTDQGTCERPIDAELNHLEHVRRLWLGHTPNTASEMSGLEQLPGMESESPPSCETTEMGDRNCQDIRARLRIDPYEPYVPSVEAVNMGIRMYFAKAHPMFPVVHAATFKPCRGSASLLASMCALGGLFTGSEHGLQQGIHLIERIIKATLQSWEHIIAKNLDMLIPIIHNAVIAQLFGLLSGSSTLLLAVDAFHGPPILWARHLRLHTKEHKFFLDFNADNAKLNEAWHEWAHGEEVLRMRHSLFIIDAELASILHREPLQSFQSYNLSPTCSENVFIASNALAWKASYHAELQARKHQILTLNFGVTLLEPKTLEQVPSTSQFTAYAILQSFSIHVLSFKAQDVTTHHSTEHFHRPLNYFYHHFLEAYLDTSLPNDPLQLIVLWHLVYMEIYADFNLLEMAVGREGCKLSEEQFSTLLSWADSEDAFRCVLHGLMIRKHIQAMSLASEPAIHTPRALFWTGLVLFCYIRFSSNTKAPASRISSEVRQFPELYLSGMDVSILLPELREAKAEVNFSLKAILLSAVDLLDKIGHWGVSRRFSALLRAICDYAFCCNESWA
ncbi:uncharacterized protein BP01DRAFT_361261, partial [Aspergillus saccharolyticus JOP 1030-1]